MSNILVLTSQYSGVVGASGICTRNIVNELENRGHNVWVLGYRNGIEEEKVYTIPRSDNRHAHGLARKIFEGVMSLLFPPTNKQIEKDFTKNAISICKENSIDTLVCVYFPLESISVLESIKKIYPQITTIVYELDSVGDGIFASSRRSFVAKKNYERWMNTNYYFADSIIIMSSHEEYWRKTWGKIHSRKLLIADIPTLCEYPKQECCNRNETPVMLYSGLLGEKYRSPYELLLIFNEISKKRSARLDFYSKGDCETMIASFSKHNPNIKQHGYVKQDVLDEAVKDADIFVSIGNRVSNSVPSKLITYFSYGKPVVHIASKAGDACEDYMKKYPLGLILYESDTTIENAQKLNDFMNNVLGKTADFSDVSKALYMNTPKYSVDLIENSIQSEVGFYERRD